MSKQLPLVSIIAICYNHEKFVDECLNSIATQTYSNIELVIIDSNSNDKSTALIDKWISDNKYPATFIKHTKNHTLPQNLNIGLRLIKGKYFQGISCDDALMPNKIEEQVAFLEKTTDEVALVYSGIILVDEQGKFLENKLYCRERVSSADIDNIPFGSIFYSSSVLFKVDTVKSIGGYDESLFYEDWDLALRLLRDYKFMKLRQSLSRYRMHSNSMTEVYNLDKCLSVVRISLREYRRNPHPAFKQRAASFSKKIVIAEKLFSYRLTNLIERFWPTFSIWVVAGIYRSKLKRSSSFM